MIDLRRADQRSFASDPSLKERLDELDRIQYNFGRSREMADTFRKAGLPDTVENNNSLFEHFLEVGQSINSQNRVRYPSTISAPNGNVKVLTTWKVLPDGKVYLTSINLIPKF